jgi:type IV pilus assembly protein PilQ
VDAPVATPALPAFPNVAGSLDSLVVIAERARPMVRAGEREVEAANTMETLARRELWPDLAVAVQYGQRGGAMGTERMGSLMIGASIPIFARHRQYRMREETVAMQRMAEADVALMRADTRGKVISSPRVVTADNQKAHIEQGTEIPYVTPGSANSPATVAFKKAVLRLEVTPQITPDNRIIMTVEVRKDNVGQFVDLGGGFRVPSIDTRNVTTQIHVNNGDTAVIGGIFEETITNDVTKVPILGDIPFFGYLFKTTGRISDKQELLIFLTPRVVKETINAIK